MCLFSKSRSSLFPLLFSRLRFLMRGLQALENVYDRFSDRRRASVNVKTVLFVSRRWFAKSGFLVAQGGGLNAVTQWSLLGITLIGALIKHNLLSLASSNSLKIVIKRL